MSTQNTTQLPTRLTAATWDLDPTHSAAEFAVKHLMIATVKGTMALKSGVVEPTAEGSFRIEAELDPSTIDTRTADRDAHLRSADFLDVENHPSIRFVSTDVEALGHEQYRVQGDLTILGVTKPVTLEAEFEGEAADPWGKHRAAITATTTLSRGEWGLTWNQALEAGGWLVGDKVKVTLHVQAVRRD